jgi:predicted O-methyltransferase YrrM
MRSLRFAPHWRPDDPYQVIGLLRLVNDILTATPAASRWLEIGSYAGESATLFLGFPQIKSLDCVDQWQMAADRLRSKFAREIAAGRCRVHQMSSAAFASVAGEYDVVYIDGDHSYDAVRADIAAYSGKLAPGGFLAGHDYHAGYPGVIQAVDEWRENKPVTVYEDGSWCVRMPL